MRIVGRRLPNGRERCEVRTECDSGGKYFMGEGSEGVANFSTTVTKQSPQAYVVKVLKEAPSR